MRRNYTFDKSLTLQIKNKNCLCRKLIQEWRFFGFKEIVSVLAVSGGHLHALRTYVLEFEQMSTKPGSIKKPLAFQIEVDNSFLEGALH